MDPDTGIKVLCAEAGDRKHIDRIDKDATIRLLIHDTTDDVEIVIGGFGERFLSIEMDFESINALIHHLQLVMADRLSPHGQLEKEQAIDSSRAQAQELIDLYEEKRNTHPRSSVE